MAHFTASTSFSMVEYFFSAGESLRLMNNTGQRVAPTCWLRTAPRLEPEASVANSNGGEKSGLCSTGLPDGLFRRLLKAASEAAVHRMGSGAVLVRQSVNAPAREAKSGIKWL